MNSDATSIIIPIKSSRSTTSPIFIPKFKSGQVTFDVVAFVQRQSSASSKDSKTSKSWQPVQHICPLSEAKQLDGILVCSAAMNFIYF